MGTTATTMATTTMATTTTTTGPTGPVASLGASLGAFSINPEWGTSLLLQRVESKSISDNDTPSSNLYSIIAQKITLILSAKVFILYHFADRSGWRVLTNG